MVVLAMVRTPKMIFPPAVSRTFFVAVLALALASCTATEVRDTLHVGGKVVYDSLKNIGQNDRWDDR